MRNTGFVMVFGAVALGALILGLWYGGWTKKDVTKVMGTAQEKFHEIKEDAEAAVKAATS